MNWGELTILELIIIGPFAFLAMVLLILLVKDIWKSYFGSQADSVNESYKWREFLVKMIPWVANKLVKADRRIDAELSQKVPHVFSGKPQLELAKIERKYYEDNLKNLTVDFPKMKFVLEPRNKFFAAQFELIKLQKIGSKLTSEQMRRQQEDDVSFKLSQAEIAEMHSKVALKIEDLKVEYPALEQLHYPTEAFWYQMGLRELEKGPPSLKAFTYPGESWKDSPIWMNYHYPWASMGWISMELDQKINKSLEAVNLDQLSRDPSEDILDKLIKIIDDSSKMVLGQVVGDSLKTGDIPKETK